MIAWANSFIVRQSARDRDDGIGLPMEMIRRRPSEQISKSCFAGLKRSVKAS